MRVSCLLLLTLPVLIIAQQYPQQFFPVQEEYDYDITDVELQDKNLRKLTTGPGEFEEFKTEPTEPGPLDCREEQYPCTRLYSVHQPCKQCLNSLCFYRSVNTHAHNIRFSVNLPFHSWWSRLSQIPPATLLHPFHPACKLFFSPFSHFLLLWTVEAEYLNS
ncbi:microfibrillar-associated protein 2 isoform X1 [Denticeps clupeoides]|uniref:microfibrillar-associated protein 2 isoform X1 n=1 Tax=Denticeps clupeoides TaxID=299321 RepID=UPI0010A319EC|nr:microfibrillar-associated protein 2 isoform X1 [Denticeps clupeoides]